jgi:CheY-like chemotaxis protein
MLGWAVLSHLKQNPATRHIPVQIVTSDEDQQHGLSRGAFAFIPKPATTELLESAILKLKDFSSVSRKRLLVVEDDPAEQMSIRELLMHDDIDIEVATSGEEALANLREGGFDCIVLDLRLPDMTGFEVLERMHEDKALRDIPVVVFTGKELNADEESRLQALARKVVVKGVESPERLFDETALFLHRVISNMPAEKLRLIEKLHHEQDLLAGKEVLVVDDDVRNIFALSSILERHGMIVKSATTGREAIEILENEPDVSAVLMDIMMPEMDGYETIKHIRHNSRFRRLPIIALTAKAMKGDRDKCLEAGASDYLAKPVNTEQLLNTIKLWLFR